MHENTTKDLKYGSLKKYQPYEFNYMNILEILKIQRIKYLYFSGIMRMEKRQ